MEPAAKARPVGSFEATSEVEKRAEPSPRVLLALIALGRRRGDGASDGAHHRLARRVIARHRAAAARANVDGEVELRGDRIAQADAELREVLRRVVRAGD